MVYLTKKQQKQIVELAPARTQILIKTLLETGCTTDEICNLKRSDVEKTSIRVQGRQTEISQELREQLLESKGEYLFSTRQSPQITPRRVQQLVKKALKAIGKDATPQLLRYAHIQEKSKEETPEQISKRLGLTKRRVEEIIGAQKEQTPITPTKATDRDGLLYELIQETSCTATQAARLHKSDIRQNSLLLENREVQVSTSFAKRLLTHSKTHTSEYVFSTRQSVALTPRRIQQILKKKGVTPTKVRYESLRAKTVEQAQNQTSLGKRRIAQIRGAGGIQ